MGHWGIKSYENDEAADALDRALEDVHGEAYDRLMDDRDPTPFDDAQNRLLDARTLERAIEVLVDQFGGDSDSWDDSARLALAGVVVRHAERGIPCPEPWLRRAMSWLESESIEWHESTRREFQRRKEIELLLRPNP